MTDAYNDQLHHLRQSVKARMEKLPSSTPDCTLPHAGSPTHSPHQPAQFHLFQLVHISYGRYPIGRILGSSTQYPQDDPTPYFVYHVEVAQGIIRYIAPEFLSQVPLCMRHILSPKLHTNIDIQLFKK